MFLIDPNLQEVPVLVLANTRTVTSCPTSTHRDNFRGDDYILRDIDSVRNGLLLGASLHRAFGKHLPFKGFV